MKTSKTPRDENLQDNSQENSQDDSPISNASHPTGCYHSTFETSFSGKFNPPVESMFNSHFDPLIEIDSFTTDSETDHVKQLISHAKAAVEIAKKLAIPILLTMPNNLTLS